MIRFSWRKLILFCISVLLVPLGIIILHISRSHNSPHRSTLSEQHHESSKIITDILTDNHALYAYVKTYGAKKTIEQLQKLAPSQLACHNAAHKTGEFAYQILKDKAYKTCSAGCLDGCYHGVTEAYFRDNGTTNLTEKLKQICGSESTKLDRWNCIHGVGHGLMAWTNYELFDALKSCDLLPSDQETCYNGVFMENITGASTQLLTDRNNAGHFTKYLNNDPEYPCNIVEDKYKQPCYIHQGTRMLELFNKSFAKVSQECLKAPQAYQISCFYGIGLAARYQYFDNLYATIFDCSFVPKGEFRTACLRMAAVSFLLDRDEDNAILFCKILTDNTEKATCYRSISQSAFDVIPSKDNVRLFCLKEEFSYQYPCLKQVQ